jgi:hypothetical protein
MFLVVLMICSTTPQVKAQAQDDKPMSPEQKAWVDYMTPGPMHDMFKADEGKWKVTTTFWMAPGAPAQSSEGESTCKMIMGGRYLQTEFHGIYMGKPFDGMGIDGYDNALGVFRSIWLDNMGTGVMTMTGKMDPKTKVVSYQGKMVDPQSKKEMDCWTTFTQSDADHQDFQMFSKIKGKKFKIMEMISEREK